MEFFADWHTHSTYSDGRGTIEDNIKAAAARGLDEIAITDHGPRNIGVGVARAETYLKIKEEVRLLDENYPDIRVRAGGEADIVASDGSIDIPRNVAKELDILIVGLHPYIWPATLEGVWNVVGANRLATVSRGIHDRVRTANTKALKEAVARYEVDFISHPDLKMPVDVAELAEFCAAQGTALEINTGHHYDKDGLVRAALQKGVNFVVNSDAHFPETVGELASGGLLLEKYNVPPERIINARNARH